MSLLLVRVRVQPSRAAQAWMANSYAVHQRLSAAFPQDDRLLFRVEDERTILVQAHQSPRWQDAFAGLNVLDGAPDEKVIDPQPQAGAMYHFRLLANPVRSRVNGTSAGSDEGLGDKRPSLTRGKRVGLWQEEEQRTWLERKLRQAGAEVVAVRVNACGVQRSRRPSHNRKGVADQIHCAVRFAGLLHVLDPVALREALEAGVGPAKAYGFGLLSLAPASPPV